MVSLVEARRIGPEFTKRLDELFGPPRTLEISVTKNGRPIAGVDNDAKPFLLGEFKLPEYLEDPETDIILVASYLIDGGYLRVDISYPPTRRSSVNIYVHTCRPSSELTAKLTKLIDVGTNSNLNLEYNQIPDSSLK